MRFLIVALILFNLCLGSCPHAIVDGPNTPGGARFTEDALVIPIHRGTIGRETNVPTAIFILKGNYQEPTFLEGDPSPNSVSSSSLRYGRREYSVEWSALNKDKIATAGNLYWLRQGGSGTASGQFETYWRNNEDQVKIPLAEIGPALRDSLITKQSFVMLIFRAGWVYPIELH